MTTDSITRDLARTIEHAEINAWNDMWDAFPNVASHFEMKKVRLGDAPVVRDATSSGGALMLKSPQIDFDEFNRVMGLGLTHDIDEPELGRILDDYRAAGIERFLIHVIPQSQPELAGWLTDRGLHDVRGWDRIYRDGSPLDNNVKLPHGISIEKVTPETAEEWSHFIVTTYDLEPTRAMLLAFSGRRGWHHYILRDGADIAWVRSMYVHTDGVAWLGVEAPVPGLMSDRFDLDYYVCSHIVADGLALGASLFVADIEDPDPQMKANSYMYIGKLGFKKAYYRQNFGYDAARSKF